MSAESFVRRILSPLRDVAVIDRARSRTCPNYREDARRRSSASFERGDARPTRSQRSCERAAGF